MDAIANQSKAPTQADGFIRAGTVDELRARGCAVVSGGKHGLAVFWHEDKVYAVDNRCPHMGFPLSKGTLKHGVLTCHWHHARFDLESGGTFDPFADDVTVYPAEIRDGDVWVDLRPAAKDRKSKLIGRLEDGLEQDLSLVIAKSVLRLDDVGASADEALLTGAMHGVRYRDAGWGPGLTIMTALANVLGDLAPEHRPLALYHGLVRVASDTDGQAPRFGLDPLPEPTAPLGRLTDWYREYVQVRHAEGAERCLLSALAQGATPADAVGMIGAAATDHPFVNTGHTIDFTNKAFEILDNIGWQHASTVLTSLIGQTTRAARNEERSSWRYPIDLIAIVRDAETRLPSLLAMPSKNGHASASIEPLAEAILADDAVSGISAMLRAFENGWSVTTVSQALAYAAAIRVAQFHTSNEFGDWITVLHTFSYCNALDQLLRRMPPRGERTADVARGLFAGAAAIYLDRFLNTPAQRLPTNRDMRGLSDDGDKLLQRLIDLTNRQQEVEPAAAVIHRYLTLGHDDRPLLQMLAQVLLREDAEFHSYQMLEAGFRQYHQLKGSYPAIAGNVLIAVARYLAGHSPTDRAMTQTYNIAVRLNRGEELYKEAD